MKSIMKAAPSSCLPVTSPAGDVSGKKNEIGTSSALAMSCSRLAPTRLVPFSYFWICWKVMPSFSPSFSWLRPSSFRRMRTRPPT